MNEMHDYYKILGLQPGASQTEIKKAYRQLVKLYHPDYDQSPDSDIMYREIRIAYEKLLNWNNICKTDIKTGTITGKGINTNARTVGSSYSSNSTWTSEDWDNWERKNLSKHIRKSQEGIFSNLIPENLFLASAFAAWSCVSSPIRGYTPPGIRSYLELATLYHIVLWTFFVCFRRYFSPSGWPFHIKFVAGTLYGLILAILVALFCKKLGAYLIWTWVTAAISAWILMADYPIPWRRGSGPCGEE